MTIYCLTEWSYKMTGPIPKYFNTLRGVSDYLVTKQPIDNKLNVPNVDTQEQYDITPDNLNYLLESNKQNNLCPLFSIVADFFIQKITINYTLSTIDVND